MIEFGKDIKLVKLDNIYNVDCIDFMQTLPDNFLDLTVTSPPYNVGIDYDNHDDAMSEEDYFAFIQTVSDELYRVTKVGGRICINIPFIGNSSFKAKSEKLIFYPNLYMPILEKSGWTIRDFVVWVKSGEAENPNDFCGNSTQWGSWLSPSCPYMRCFAEVILVFHKEDKKLGHTGISDLTKDEFMELTKNVWYFRTATDKKKHPAQFPIELPRRCIKLYSYVDDLVFDPFMGIGNTAMACIETKRHYLGCDISKDYVDEANRQKITLEQEIENLEAKKVEMQKLSDKVVSLNETIKKEEETIKKYEVKKNELLGSILEIEAREKKVSEEEKFNSKRNTELYQKEQNLLIENKILDEKQRNLKKIYDKLNT